MLEDVKRLPGLPNFVTSKMNADNTRVLHVTFEKFLPDMGNPAEGTYSRYFLPETHLHLLDIVERLDAAIWNVMQAIAEEAEALRDDE